VNRDLLKKFSYKVRLLHLMFKIIHPHAYTIP